RARPCPVAGPPPTRRPAPPRQAPLPSSAPASPRRGELRPPPPPADRYRAPWRRGRAVDVTHVDKPAVSVDKCRRRWISRRRVVHSRGAPPAAGGGFSTALTPDGALLTPVLSIARLAAATGHERFHL